MLEKPFECFVTKGLPIWYLPSQNPFAKIFYNKRAPISARTLQEYAKKCSTVIDKVDYMSLISPSDEIQRLPIFRVSNTTNSSEKMIDLYNWAPNHWQPVVKLIDENDKNHTWYIDLSHQFWNFTLVKTIATNWYTKYLLTVIYENETIPLFDFYFYNENSREANQNGFRSKIEIKWKPFQLQFITWWAFDIKTILFVFLSQWYAGNDDDIRHILENFYITRLDYCFDFFAEKGSRGLTPSDIFNRKRKHKSTYRVFNDSYAETFSFWVKNIDGSYYTWWQYWNRKDSYVFSRFYHKQIDIKETGADMLYYEWLKYQWEVWRLEFQFGTRFCNNKDNLGKIYFYDEFEKNILTNRVYEYVWLANQSGCYSPKYVQQQIPFDSLSKSHQMRKLNTFKNLAKTLSDAWHNVIQIAYDSLSEAQKLNIITNKREIKKEIYSILRL